jgi:uncharacterized protein (DUF2141 family)
MKSLKISLTLASLAVVSIMAVSCGKSRLTGDINVSLTVLSGQTVDLTGIEVQIHGTSMFENVLFSQDATGSASSASALFEDLEPGRYYICAWNDKDGDLTYSAGDHFGFYPYPLDLVKRDQKEITVEVYLLD